MFRFCCNVLYVRVGGLRNTRCTVLYGTVPLQHGSMVRYWIRQYLSSSYSEHMKQPMKMSITHPCGACPTYSTVQLPSTSSLKGETWGVLMIEK